jgi:hypothetical protein
VGVGDNFSTRQLVRVPKYNTIEEHQGKNYHEAVRNGLTYLLTEEH